MRKSKLKKEDIVVFAFRKGSQARIEESKSSTYKFVDKAINRMLASYNVTSEKIAFSGFRDDINNFVSGLIDVYVKIYNVEIDKVEDFDPVDFDPDIDIDDAEIDM